MATEAGNGRKPSKARLILATMAVVIVCAWLGFAGFVGWAMRQPPEVFGSVMAKMPGPLFLALPFEYMWTRARKGTLNPGDTAPDFNLETYDKSGRVELTSFRGKQPVVLVFGSYT